MEEGILKGKAEGKAEGDDLARVSKITGLSEEELQKLLS
jgi:hypothetical protein